MATQPQHALFCRRETAWSVGVDISSCWAASSWVDYSLWRKGVVIAATIMLSAFVYRFIEAPLMQRSRPKR